MDRVPILPELLQRLDRLLTQPPGARLLDDLRVRDAVQRHELGAPFGGQRVKRAVDDRGHVGRDRVLLHAAVGVIEGLLEDAALSELREIELRQMLRLAAGGSSIRVRPYRRHRALRQRQPEPDRRLEAARGEERLRDENAAHPRLLAVDADQGAVVLVAVRLADQGSLFDADVLGNDAVIALPPALARPVPARGIDRRPGLVEHECRPRGKRRDIGTGGEQEKGGKQDLNDPQCNVHKEFLRSTFYLKSNEGTQNRQWELIKGTPAVGFE